MGETPYTTDEAKSQTLSSTSYALYWNLSPKIVWINKGSIGEEMGTGVCIKIGTHFFIATAAHVLKPKGKIHVISKPPFKEIDPFPISPIHVGTDENVDVAFLEIEESIALDLQTEFLELKDLLVQTAPLDDLVFMAGFPTEYARLRNQANQVHVEPLLFLGNLINPTGNPLEWKILNIHIHRRTLKTMLSFTGHKSRTRMGVLLITIRKCHTILDAWKSPNRMASAEAVFGQQI